MEVSRLLGFYHGEISNKWWIFYSCYAWLPEGVPFWIFMGDHTIIWDFILELEEKRPSKPKIGVLTVYICLLFTINVRDNNGPLDILGSENRKIPTKKKCQIRANMMINHDKSWDLYRGSQPIQLGLQTNIPTIHQLEQPMKGCTRDILEFHLMPVSAWNFLEVCVFKN